ncbi:MAG TPA: hypothetical protein VIL43_05100 [Burkholderiales bacterium]
MHYELLPAERAARLPPLPPNGVPIRVGQDFAILDTRTRIVLDVAAGRADPTRRYRDIAFGRASRRSTQASIFGPSEAPVTRRFQMNIEPS